MTLSAQYLQRNADIGIHMMHVLIGDFAAGDVTSAVMLGKVPDEKEDIIA